MARDLAGHAPRSPEAGRVVQRMPDAAATVKQMERAATDSPVGVTDPYPACEQSAFARAVGAPPDPILGLIGLCAADPSPHKLNVAVGVYRAVEGTTLYPYVLPSVQKAEAELLKLQADRTINKEYLPADGMPAFCKASLRLLLGADCAAIAEDRVACTQSISGTGALHLAARMIGTLLPGKPIYLPAPTWPIHKPIMELAGLEVRTYTYYSAETAKLDWDGLVAALRDVEPGSAVLIHACAHNPSGCDPTVAQWAELGQIIKARRIVPLVDSAYQGFATGDFDADGAGIRTLAGMGIEMLVCQSYSKNMGLYGERAGTFSMVCKDKETAAKLQTQLRGLIRLIYSSPPRHGAAIAAHILNDEKLIAEWKEEVCSPSSPPPPPPSVRAFSRYPGVRDGRPCARDAFDAARRARRSRMPAARAYDGPRGLVARAQPGRHVHSDRAH